MKTDIEQGESEMAKTDIAVKLDMPTPSTVLTKTLFECHACGVVSFETTRGNACGNCGVSDRLLSFKVKVG